MSVTASVVSYPARSYNAVTVAYSAEPYKWGKLLRVDETTGDETPVYPAVADNGDCMLISCDGKQLWWDTTVPFGRPYHYRAQPCTPGFVQDTFTRVTASGWGSPDFGAAWTTTGGAAGDYSTTGSRAQHSLTSVNVRRISVTDAKASDGDFTADLRPGVVATGAPIEMGVLMRYSGSANWLLAEIRFGLSGLATLRIRKNVAGTITDLWTSTTAVFTYTATTIARLNISLVGNLLQVKVWTDARPKPVAYLTQVVDNTFLTQTSIGLTSILATGNTNAGPVNVQFDNLIAEMASSGTLTAVPTGATGSATFGEGDTFWLKDPVRPCHDRRLQLCMDTITACSPGAGVMLLGLTEETYRTRTTRVDLSGVAQRWPRGVYRRRGDAATQVVLVARSFIDRNDLLTLLEPGEPLYMHGPAVYGIPDRYLQVDDVSVQRGLPDHKFQPRVFGLPYTTRERPAGPMLGPCGEQIQDLCNVYATWDAMEAAGLTYLQLFDGTAGGPGVGV